MSEFDPRRHICKFGYELYGTSYVGGNPYGIICDLYNKELKVEFYSKQTEEIIEVFGFKFSEAKFNELVELVKWEDFEKYRDISGWDWNIEHQSGYRDGWGYKFWCLSESGLPLIEADLSVTFHKNTQPPYERLFDWIRQNYSTHKSLKNKNMIW